MKSTGIIRKIDNLGRLVIPKEIRKKLNLKKEEKIEIYVEDNKIILEKYDELVTFEKTTNEYIKIFKNIFDLDIIITNLTYIVSSTDNYNKLINKELSSEYFKIINERKIIEKKNLNIVKGQAINKNTYIKPIINNTELLGSIIIISDETITNNEKKQIELLFELMKHNLSDV